MIPAPTSVPESQQRKSLKYCLPPAQNLPNRCPHSVILYSIHSLPPEAWSRPRLHGALFRLFLQHQNVVWTDESHSGGCSESGCHLVDCESRVSQYRNATTEERASR